LGRIGQVGVMVVQVESRSERSVPYPFFVIAALTIGAALLAHIDTFAELIQRWSSEEEFSHGFFIPAISLWLLWTRRAQLANSIGTPLWLGAAVVLGSNLLLIVGRLIDTPIVGDIAFVAGMFGIVLCLGGWRLLPVTLVPVAFLAFMIPLPYAISSILTFEFQLLSSELGVWFIRLCDIPVYLEGNVIDLGAYKLGIVEACSGLRYLIPFLSLGFLGAYLYRGPFWHRVVIFLSVIPITIAMNSLRIGVIGAVSQFVGVSSAEGVLHYFEGWIVFLVCIALLYGVMALVSLFGRGEDDRGFLAVGAGAPLPGAGTIATGSPYPLIASAAMFAATALALQVGIASALIIPDRAPLAGLSTDLADWRPRVELLNPAIEEVLGADDYYIADLDIGANADVNLYIAYIEAQRENKAWHSPQQCIPGGGWVIENLTRVPVAVAGAAAPIVVNRVVIAKGRSKQLVYYWYQQRGRMIASEWTVKYYLTVDALTRNRTDGALVRLTTAIDPDQGAGPADGRMRQAMDRLYPILPTYIPE
jgi:exosortase D (VPLPA-CTERM-specific)